MPISPDLSTVLEVPTESLLIGSPLVVHYNITNNGLSLLKWFAGGDYRSFRPYRIWLEAVDELNTFAIDPLAHKSFYGMGGLCSNITVDPLGSSFVSVNPYGNLPTWPSNYSS